MRRRARVLAALFAGVVLGTAAIGVAGDWSVARLMQDLARQRGGSATFSETKYLAVLDRPVESSGELTYRPPGRLEKRTLKPVAESMILDGDVLVVERGRQKHTLQLQQYPAINALVGSVRNTLAGDRGALERQYRLDLQGGEEGWSLTLLPSDPAIAAIVQRIRIIGVRDELRQIEVLQTDGDRSVMQVRRSASQ
jgi:outer membrane lipoprotein-sorting protein